MHPGSNFELCSVQAGSCPQCPALSLAGEFLLLVSFKLLTPGFKFFYVQNLERLIEGSTKLGQVN